MNALTDQTVRPHLKQYLQYIRNTGCSATKAIFVEDWDPIGDRSGMTFWRAGP
jgi:hypothetical protein